MATSYTEAELCHLMHLVAEGDHAAFEQLIRYFEKSILAVALSVTAQRQDAEDAAQEAMVKLWRTAHTYRGECCVKAWVMTVARNTALDMKRKQKHRAYLPWETEDGHPYDLPDEHIGSNPEAAYRRREEIEAVWHGISELSPTFRQVLILRDMEGLTYHEIARMLGTSEGTVKSRVFRAREKLKNILKKRNFSL